MVVPENFAKQVTEPSLDSAGECQEGAGMDAEFTSGFTGEEVGGDGGKAQSRASDWDVRKATCRMEHRGNASPGRWLDFFHLCGMWSRVMADNQGKVTAGGWQAQHLRVLLKCRRRH